MPARAKLDASELAAAIEKYGERVSYPTAAQIVGTSVRTLKRETAAGNLPCYRVGSARVLRVKTADVLALVERVA